ncbi:rho GTPase-activating protein 31 [Bombina bombina]|uniref:rho GTPase-activating protein 31 n=1 Tax=Bombina bombina TaxID=8345 RepID=UPI00235B12F5|nr:rho GTPase-activating protein 31 [Bombina bombina]
MKNKGGKPKFKRKGSGGAFGCDLTEYLDSSGQDVPLVLKSCAEFIETHGVVDGIYRLSGVTSNIQKLRQEFGSDQCPDLTRDIYLQDIHCVGSLCKLYFRELPNPLLTYQLYKKFTDAVSCSLEGEKLSRIHNIIQELPPSHYRTLEYLSKHLTHIASYSSMTNMHIRNLALVWAPNLLRSKEIEDAGCNGDAAFLEVRVQQVVIEFILNHVDQIFNKKSNSPQLLPKHREECRVITKSMTLPSGSLPMKLVSLEEAQARSLAATHPARKERRENSLPEIVPVTGTLFHTVIDLPEHKRKLSTKSKKWKSIFNLGRSGTESKSKLSRNGSVFVRGQKELSEKATIRPAKSMDSLCSMPAEGEDEKVSRFKRSVGTGGFFIPVLKSRTTGTGSTFDLRKHDNEWETEEFFGATGGSGSNHETDSPKSLQLKAPPEQMKVFRVGDDLENEQTSPKIRKLFYTSSDGSNKSNFPGSLFPLEASPRHQRKALNISEPFAVSVPLRVSAVISTNSTPCRSSKERHILSSLEELALLEPDLAAKSIVTDTNSNGRIKEGANSTDSKEKSKMKEPERSFYKGIDSEDVNDSSGDDTLLTLQEVLLETLHFPPGHQESHFGIKTERVTSAECVHEPIKVLGKTEDLELDKPDTESVKTQQEETLKIQPSDDPFHEDQEDDTSLMDPLWPDIQQELKIIESEEELPILSDSESPPEYNQVLSLSDGTLELAETTNPSSSSYDLKESVICLEQNNENIPNCLALDNVQIVEEKDDNKNHTSNSITPQQSKLDISTTESSTDPKDNGSECSLPQTTQIFTGQEKIISDEGVKQKQSNMCKQESSFGILKPVPTKKDRGFNKVETQKLDESAMEVITEVLPLRSEEEKVLKTAERKSNESLENYDEIGADSMQTFELDESWEDHQWVTSPLHSPKLKNVPERETLILPKRRGTTGQIYKRPEFTRSLSLDSKDTRTTQWTLRLVGRNKPDSLHIRPETDNLFKESYCMAKEELLHCQKMVTLQELSKNENKNETICRDLDVKNRQSNKPMLEISNLKNSGTVNSNMQFPTLPSNSLGCLSNVLNENMRSSGCNQEKSINTTNCSNENSEEKPKTRPSSLTLDTVVPTGDLFSFENISPISAQGHKNVVSPSCAQGRKNVVSPSTVQVHQILQSQSTVSPLNSTDIIHWKDNSWKSQSHLHNKDTDWDHMSLTHTPTARRNSAPVSVSAVRASFMIKMCQAKAVPVIPPKVQYTQIPQPLQIVHTDAEVVEKKEICQSDCNTAPKQTLPPSKGQNDIPKSPSPEKKAVEEKENNDPVSSDSSHHSSLNSSIENSRTVSQDAPVLRRKRISDGEPSGDTLLSSKIERPGLSRSSFRSRTGRPQSLILFSPPFPIMDHPLTPDSRILLSPIKSPSETTSHDSSFENQKTPDGVILRNKLTIPKNGQRLETSTSCFYQPQRRSVILDSRGGRQFE